MASYHGLITCQILQAKIKKLVFWQLKYSNQKFLSCGFKIKQVLKVAALIIATQIKFLFHYMKSKWISNCIINVDKVISENDPDKMFKVAGLAEGGESWKAFFITCQPVVQQVRKTGGGGLQDQSGNQRFFVSVGKCLR